MIIETELKDKQCTIFVSGRLDSNTEHELNLCVQQFFDKIDTLIFDFKNLEMITSAGIRILLASYKKMTATKGKMKICNLNDIVNEVFVITGMNNIFTIE